MDGCTSAPFFLLAPMPTCCALLRAMWSLAACRFRCLKGAGKCDAEGVDVEDAKGSDVCRHWDQIRRDVMLSVLNKERSERGLSRLYGNSNIPKLERLKLSWHWSCSRATLLEIHIFLFIYFFLNMRGFTLWWENSLRRSIETTVLAKCGRFIRFTCLCWASLRAAAKQLIATMAMHVQKTEIGSSLFTLTKLQRLEERHKLCKLKTAKISASEEEDEEKKRVF